MLRDQARNGDRFAHAAQAQQLSAAKRPWPWRCAQNVELRQRVHARLDKGEAKNALARAVFFNRLGEVRDRSFEHQRYRASGFNLVVAAIVLWNAVYVQHAVQALATAARPSTTPCCAISRRWDGSTST